MCSLSLSLCLRSPAGERSISGEHYNVPKCVEALFFNWICNCTAPEMSVPEFASNRFVLVDVVRGMFFDRHMQNMRALCATELVVVMRILYYMLPC